MLTDTQRDQAEQLLREVAAEELTPRFRNLAPEQIRDKGHDDPVTEADLAAEARLTHGLLGIVPGSRVVGEEAAHDSPELLEGLAAFDQLWVVDPLDGTKPFSQGDPRFGVMACFVERGRPTLGLIHLPLLDTTVVSAAGEGTTVNGNRTRCPPAPPLHKVAAALMDGFLPPELREGLDERAQALAQVIKLRCAAFHYAEILQGRLHGALYHRTQPWDHAAGTLAVSEAGGRARRYDGSPLQVGDDRAGLLVAPDERGWTELRRCVLPMLTQVSEAQKSTPN